MGLNGAQYLLSMAFDLDVAPLGTQFAIGCNQESAANDTHEFAAIERFLTDHIEFPAQLLVRIGDQVERELLLGFEFLVRGQAITRNAQHDGLLAAEFRVQSAEIQTLLRASRCAVFGIEIQNDVLAA